MSSGTRGGWLALLHIGLAIGTTIALVALLRLGVTAALITAATSALALFACLFHRYTFWVAAIPGTLLGTVLSALMFTAFGSFVGEKAGLSLATAAYVSAPIGVAIGLTMMIDVYRGVWRALVGPLDEIID